MRKLVAILAVMIGGCAHRPEPVQSPPGRIAELHIITSPVGLNVDNRPGTDAFSMKVYANDRRNPKTIPIEQGTLEILMFDGTFFGKTKLPPPIRTWSYEAGDLKLHQVQSAIGAGYDFLLVWGTNRPTQRLITVRARHTRPDGSTVYSDASSVTVIEK